MRAASASVSPGGRLAAALVGAWTTLVAPAGKAAFIRVVMAGLYRRTRPCRRPSQRQGRSPISRVHPAVQGAASHKADFVMTGSSFKCFQARIPKGIRA